MPERSHTTIRNRPRGVAPQELTIEVEQGTGIALFVQIREQIRDLVTRGTLVPGMRLPPVRDLARRLQVNQITVAKAYRGLTEEGIVEGRRGGGSFVRALSGNGTAQNVPALEPSQPMLAGRLYELARAPGVIAFTSNYPLADAGMVSELRACLTEVITQRLDTCMHYEPPAGRIELRRQIAQYLGTTGIVTDETSIVVTSGAQQAIDLTIRSLCAAGTGVAIEQPAYYGAINCLHALRARVLPVPMQRDGMDLDVLEGHLSRGGVRLIYTNPTFQNPSGITMSMDKRQALLALARRYKAAILEDDHSSELRFRGKPVPAIRALATDSDNIIHVRSLGKVFLPGMRIGFLVAPQRILEKLLLTKANSDLHCNGLLQETAAAFLRQQKIPRIVERLRKTYSTHQDLMHKMIAANLPKGARINLPDGGLSFWLNLPDDSDVSELYFRAVRHGVAFVDGDVFYVSQPRARSLRVSFGLNKPSELLVGVERLCSVVKDIRAKRAHNLMLT